MRKALMISVAGLGILSILAGSGLCNRTGPEPGAGDFAIYVAPSMIVKSAPCPWITIHTDVAKSTVAACNVSVDGTQMQYVYTYADSLGNIVAKVRFGEAVAAVESASATVELALALKSGDILIAADRVSVKD